MAIEFEYKSKGVESVRKDMQEVQANARSLQAQMQQQVEANEKAAAAVEATNQKRLDTVAIVKKVAMGEKKWALALKTANEGVGLLANGLSRSLGVLGPWGAAIGAAIGIVQALYKRLSKPPKTEKTAEEIQRLADAYRSLGDSATYAAAQLKVQAEEAEKRGAEEFIKRKDELAGYTDKLKEAQGIIDHYKRVAKDLGADSLPAKMWADKVREEAMPIIREYQALRGWIETQEKGLAETRRAREQREDEEIDRQNRLQAIRKDMAEKESLIELQRQTAQKQFAASQKSDAQALEYATDLRRQQIEKQYTNEQMRMQALEEVERQYQLDLADLRKKAAEKHRAEYQTQAAALLALQKQTQEKQFAASKKSDLDALQAAADTRKEQIAAQFKDAKLRAKALLEVERQYQIDLAAAQQKAAEDQAKRREKLSAQASKVRVAGLIVTEEDKAVEAAAKRRQQYMQQIANIEKLQAEYRKEYSDEELAHDSQWLTLQNQKMQAVQALGAAQLQTLGEVSDARAKDAARAQKELYDQIYAQHALTAAQKAAVNANKQGFEAMAEGMEAWGVGAAEIQKAQMLASGIQAAADAIDYSAQAAAMYAIGNIPAGIGLTAAAAGKTAAAAAYAAGLLDLGGSALPSTGSAAATAVSSASPQLAPTENKDITITFAFEGSDSQIAGALIRGMNASGRSLGGAKLNGSMINAGA